MAIEEEFAKLRELRIKQSGKPHPDQFQGVSKERVKEVLQAIDQASQDKVDVVFALLDNETPSFKAKKFSDGATVAQIGSHVNILQRGKQIKLDREQCRDYGIKPIAQIGAVEAVTLIDGEFVAGHPISKASTSSHRLNGEFKEILKTDNKIEREKRLQEWISDDHTRKRLALQAQLAEAAKKQVDSKHGQLIQDVVDYYVPKFLPGYEVIYVDDSDGERTSEDEKKKLKEAGVELGLEDAYPDVLLWNKETDELWVIEAVTSDGEVDAHKMQNIRKLAERHKKKGVGFTTAYRNHGDYARRQAANKNLGIDSYVWICNDASRQLRVESFKEEARTKTAKANNQE
jgi:hypothetical protein